MFCSYCGYEITGAGRFCSDCGAEQKNAAPQNGGAANAGVSPQKPSLKTEFQIDTAKTYRSLGMIVLLAGSAMLVLMIFGVLISLLVDEPSLFELIAGVMFGLIFFVVCATAALLAFTFGNQCIYFSGGNITVKKLWSKVDYDCSNIVNIRCSKTQVRYSMLYNIEWTFSDGKKYYVNTAESGFFEAAAYFHHMADIGMISQRAVTPQTKEMLRRYAVKAW